MKISTCNAINDETRINCEDRCIKSSTRFFIRNDTAAGLPFRRSVGRCEFHSSGVLRVFFNEVSLEEYLIFEVMDS